MQAHCLVSSSCRSPVFSVTTASMVFARRRFKQNITGAKNVPEKTLRVCKGLYQLRNRFEDSGGPGGVGGNYFFHSLGIAGHREFSCSPPFAPVSSFLKGWGRALASQGPWWHRDHNRNQGKKSLDCLAWLELRMSSGASWSLFPSLNTMQQTLLWSLCLCPCLRSR